MLMWHTIWLVYHILGNVLLSTKLISQGLLDKQGYSMMDERIKEIQNLTDHGEYEEATTKQLEIAGMYVRLMGGTDLYNFAAKMNSSILSSKCKEIKLFLQLHLPSYWLTMLFCQSFKVNGCLLSIASLGFCSALEGRRRVDEVDERRREAYFEHF